MKKLIAITTSILVLTFFSAVSAHADRKTVEGFILGTGIAVLSAAIYNGVHKSPSLQPQHTPTHFLKYEDRHAYRHDKQNTDRRHYRHQGPSGHWEIERVWIAPVYEKKWNPGHYNPRGEWISGRHEKFLIQNGFWQEEKIWVRY